MQALLADNSSASIHTDVLIIGAGLAGLSTALALPQSLNIMILSKAALETCSSHYAQGGIAASLNENDTVTAHVADTLTAGAGLCTIDNTAQILSAGQEAIQWLCEQGVPFTQIPKSDSNQNFSTINPLAPLKTADLHLTQEGGHGCRRVAHADDATGRHIMQTLSARVQTSTNITILPYHEALSLLTEPNSKTQITSDLKDKHCQGAIVFDYHNQRQLTFNSGAVVLASGGLGQLFQRASAPNVCVGDGIMMAWQAGCRLANLEFVQFHPTGLALKDSSFLISEALRGEGGHLYCPQTGVRFMLNIDSRAELAPRDIVARAIAEQIHNNGLGYVHLDVSHLPAKFLRKHFPQIHQTLLALGIDITIDPIPVAPTAHYSCGGVVTCTNGLTDVQGLYAAGEVAYTGLHGANRLASNSLLECVVIGRNIAAHLPTYLRSADWDSVELTNIQPIILPLFGVITEYNDNRKAHSAINTINDFHKITAKLKALMSSHMGITRSAELLEQALEQIQGWQGAIKHFNLERSNSLDRLNDLDNLSNMVMSNELIYFRLERQLRLATLIVQSAYQRCESRGGHYRKDYPDLAKNPLISVIEPLINKADTMNDPLEWLSSPILTVNSA
ncbi:L-aspartate oxidase [Psychrobacter sp. GP33]|uniref:L-aspartate oxidase n=1 Tax=Psychrobacter sp. GP33 TaxID=2758709 RepID=UPI0015FC18D4|nr:L-aspartate oxidase [Psychrobacter sp. GP33]